MEVQVELFGQSQVSLKPDGEVSNSLGFPKLFKARDYMLKLSVPMQRI